MYSGRMLERWNGLRKTGKIYNIWSGKMLSINGRLPLCKRPFMLSKKIGCSKQSVCVMTTSLPKVLSDERFL